ncbi:MAG: hypothetical protein LBJ13_04140 [Puniceicoccales bacterium]|jgi:hypothetical protein|nr:hypothetical protein [Puniceicoccales bacterium]
MKIKAISDKVWNELRMKPFIVIGFHAHRSKVIAMAVNDEGIYALKIIDDSHNARQDFFSEISVGYKGSPIAASNRRTERFLDDFFEERTGKNTALKIILKGPEEKLKNWKSELENAFLRQKRVIFSADNPVQHLDL